MARYAAITLNGSGGVQELIPAMILPEVQITAAREEVFMPLSRRIDLTGPGDTFDMPQGGALTWTAYTGGNSPDEQAFNTAARTLTPALRQLDIVIPIDVLQGTVVNLQDAVAREAGLGLAANRDAGFAALYTEAPDAVTPDHTLGTDGVALSFVSLRSFLDTLYIREAPRRFAWVVYPTQWAGELLLDDTLINASVKGSPVLTQGVGANGFVTSVLDCDIYISPQIVESSGRHSMAFSKNAALGYGFKRLTHPVTGESSEVLMDMDWNAARRSIEMCLTYHADFEGLFGSSTTTNTWLCNIIS